jgi:Putative thioesterase (yiiD_Cterm)
MDAAALELSLHQRIPLSRAMGVAVLEAAPARVALAAPLAPNVNHSGTVFGGSAASVAVLSAWSLVEVRPDRHPAQRDGVREADRGRLHGHRHAGRGRRLGQAGIGLAARPHGAHRRAQHARVPGGTRW